MRRLPNPWVAIPSVLAGLIAGGLGWVVTDVSCRPQGCTGWAIGISIFGFLVGLVGMAVVIVLVYRSIAEWREATEQGREPPGPGCEV